MKNLTSLPIGTKLMWDASPNTYLTGENKGELIIYPAIISDQSKIGNRNSRRGAKIKTSVSPGSWMGDENQYLRHPTEIELNTLTWPLI